VRLVVCGHVWSCVARLRCCSGQCSGRPEATCDRVPARILSMMHELCVLVIPSSDPVIRPKGPKSRDPELQKMNNVL
jgi:hypothetical protein